MQNESSEIDPNSIMARKVVKRYQKKNKWPKSQTCLQQVRLKKEAIVVVVPAPIDILCGRGRSYISHEGNQRFRDVIFQHIGAYLQSSHRSRRSEVVKAVVHEMFRSGARFLKQLDNKLEWYDGGVKVAKKKVGHALRDAASSWNQKISKKNHFLHNPYNVGAMVPREQFFQHQQQLLLLGHSLKKASSNWSQKSFRKNYSLYQQKQNATNGTTWDTLGKVTFPISSHRFLLDNKDTNEFLMESKRMQSSPCLDDERMSSMNEYKHIPAETLRFSDSSFHTEICNVFPKNDNSESVTHDDMVDSGTMGNHEAAAICLANLDNLIHCDGNVKEPIFETIKLYTPYVEGVEQSNSKSSLVFEVTWIFYKHCDAKHFTASFLKTYHHDETVDRGAAMESSASKNM